MDQSTTLSTYDRRRAAIRLADFIVRSIDAARAVEKPFFHLEFDRVFPDDAYAQILALMPESADYRPMHGRSKGHDLRDGTHTRVKIDLFPEYMPGTKIKVCRPCPFLVMTGVWLSRRVL